MRPLTDCFIEWKYGQPILKLKGGTYNITAVWNEIRSKLKHCTITWMALHDHLPTLGRLISWGIQTDELCCFRKVEMETRDHLYFWLLLL